MNKLIRFYNQNRKLFFILVLILVLMILGLQVLNYFTKKSIEKEKNIDKNIYVDTNYAKQHEAVSGNKKTEEIYNVQKNIIEKFLNSCNEKDFEKAYDLLSEDCKENLYPSINSFIDGYYHKTFDKKKSYSYHAWNNNTYKIELRPDILSTGMYSDSAYTEDYYTIEGNKLNINGYMGKKKIDKQIEKHNVKIKIVHINFYKDYAECSMQVMNKTNKTILLDSRDKTDHIYLVDKNKVNFDALISELQESELIILEGENKKINIRFNCVYRENLEMKKISFNRIIMDYNKYKNNELENEDIKKIEFDL